MRPHPQWSDKTVRTSALSLLFFAGAGVSFLYLVSPHTGSPSNTAMVSATAASLAVCATLFALRHQVRPWMEHAALVLGVAMVGGVVEATHRAATTSWAAGVYTWAAVYAAHWFSQRAARAHWAWIAASYGAVLAYEHPPWALTGWIVVVATVVVVGTEVAQLSARLRRQAVTDLLTGGVNRHGLEIEAEREIGRASRSGYPLSVAMIDLDGFKRVNDEHGHAAGDTLLAHIVSHWHMELRASDVLARLGGDEFVILLPNTNLAQANDLISRLGGTEVCPWSVGLAEWSQGDSLASLLARADTELYRTKARRHNAQADPDWGPDAQADANEWEADAI